MLSTAIQHYVLKGNLRRAATQQQHLAEVYEVELGDQKKALEAYEKAAEWFESDNAEAYVFSFCGVWMICFKLCLTCDCRLANKYFLKVADLSALEGDYHKAIDLFERVARSSINNRLMRYSVNEYFLKAGICHLASRVSPRDQSKGSRAIAY